MILGSVLALLQALTWAVTSIVLRGLSRRLDPFIVNGVRAGIALLVIIPLALLTGGRDDYGLITAERMLYLGGSIIIGGVMGDAFYVNSLRLLGVSRAFPITNSYPLFTVALGALLLGERVTLPMIVGMLLVLLGVYAVARPRRQVLAQSTAESLPPKQLLAGVGMALGTAMAWGLSTVVLARGLEGIHSIVANSVRVPLVMLVALPVGAARGGLRDLRRMDRRTTALLVAAGLLGWGIGGSLFVTAVQLAGASRTAIIGATSPLFAVPLSALFLGERPTRYTLLGTLLCVAGIVLVIL